MRDIHIRRVRQRQTQGKKERAKMCVGMRMVQIGQILTFLDPSGTEHPRERPDYILLDTGIELVWTYFSPCCPGSPGTSQDII